MNESERYDQICKPALETMNDKLDQLLKAVVLGNGQPSLLVRVDRLEQCKLSVSKAFWLAASAFVTAIGGTIWGIVTRSGK